MIIVEIEIPMIGKKYDFQIQEDIPLYDVKEEITEMICRKEQYPLAGKTEQLLMYVPETGQRLNLAETALHNGLRTGSRVLLI